MNATTTKLLSPLPLLLLAACGGDPDAAPGTLVGLSDLTGSPFVAGSGAVDRAGAEQRALDLLGGTVLDVEAEFERGLEIWEVEVRRSSGALVEIDIVAESGDVLEIECDRHVAGDDLSVEPGYLSLAEAIRIATDARSGTVEAWELELDDGLRWTWEIELTDGDDEFDVEVDAETGAVDPDHDRDDDWDDRVEPTASIVAAARAILPDATITEAEREDDGWDLDLVSSSGADIDLELDADGQLLEANGDEGPFDYAVTPSGLISLADALSAAGRTADELDSWELEGPDDDDDDRDDDDDGFVWSLDFDDDEIDVDAVTGTVL